MKAHSLTSNGTQILGMPPSQLIALCIAFAALVFVAVVIARFLNDEHREEAAHEKARRQFRLETEALRLSSEKRRAGSDD